MEKPRRKFSLSRADSRFSSDVSVTETELDALEEMLSTPYAISLTTKQADTTPKSELAKLKDVGWWFPGIFDPPSRKRDSLVSRSAVVLDADHLDPWEDADFLVGLAEERLGCRALAHTTFSHRPGRPRARLVLPLAEDIPAALYEGLSRSVAKALGMDMFDFTTHQPSRIMYLPSKCSDCGFGFAKSGGGALLDWRGVDISRPWPSHRGEPPLPSGRPRSVHPHDRPGVVGAFCRAFDIEDGIARFGLPYDHAGGTRWRYSGGSGVDGAVVYPAEQVLHSWHESDPAAGQHCLFDLVRLHRWGGLDKDVLPGGGVADLPSQAEAVAFALGLPEVRKELESPDYASDFAKLPDGVDGEAPATLFEALERELSGKGSLPRDVRVSAVRRIAAARLPASDTGLLAALLAKRSSPKVAKTEVMADIKAERRLLSGTEGEDLDYMIVDSLLSRHYEGGAHVRRFARLYWQWMSGVWARVDDEIVRDRLQRTIAAIRQGEGDRGLVEAVRESSTAQHSARVWPMACAHVAGLDPSPDPMRLMELEVEAVVNCRNCELVFDRDGSFRRRGHDPARMLTHMIGVDYDPQADTGPWDRFMSLMFRSASDPEDMARHLEEVMGYAVQPWRELASVCIMRGEPAAGKTTLGQLLNLMVGQAGVNAELSRYTGRDTHDLAGLVGKLLLLDEDFKAGGLLPDGFLRRISEAKHMSANPKFGNQFGFVCRTLPFVIANSWPATKDHAGGLERRALCWDLPAIPEERRDPAARRELLSMQGRQGALVRWLQGFSRLYRRGSWDVPGDCREASEEWLRVADSVALWADDTLVPGLDAFLPRAGLYTRYVSWHRASVPGGRPVGKREFHVRLRRRLGEETKSGEPGWKGLAFSGESVDI